jgi:hypothetical protein
MIIHAQSVKDLSPKDELRLLHNLISKALLGGWGPEDIRVAELLTGKSCEWKEMKAH